MRARGERIIVFGDSLTHHGHDVGPEIWDVDVGSGRVSSAPGDLLASMLAEQGAEAVRTNARVGRSAWNFWNRENTNALLASDRAFRPTRVVVMLGTNDVGLNTTLDREAFAKIRDAYQAMGAEVWAIGPFSNTNLPAAGVEAVVKSMSSVFGMRFIDGRPLSTMIATGRDRVHYDQTGARQLALSLTDALISKISPRTLIGSVALGALGIGAALIGGLAWKRYKNRSLGDVAAPYDDPLEAKRKIFELLMENKDGSRAVARDIAIDHGMIRTATIKNVEKNRGYPGTMAIELDTGERFWTSTAADLQPGAPLDFLIDREESWVKDDAGNNLKHLHPARIFNRDHVWSESLLKRYVNRWWPEDSSPLLEGLDLPKVSRDAIDELIQSPDPAALDIAQDAMLQRGDKLTQIARTGGTVGPHTFANFDLDLGEKSRIAWRVTSAGTGRCIAQFAIWAHGQKVNRISHPEDRAPQDLAYDFDAGYYGAGDFCERAAAADAWSIAKAVKRLPTPWTTKGYKASGGDPKERQRAAVKAINEYDEIANEAIRKALDAQDNSEPSELWGPEIGAHAGESGKDVDFHKLIREDDPAAMDVAEDLLLERGTKIRGATGGSRHMSIDVGAKHWFDDKEHMKMVSSSVAKQPEDGGPGTYPADAVITREIDLSVRHGSHLVVAEKIKVKATIEDARKYAAAATWALAKTIKPLPLDTPEAELKAIIDDMANQLRNKRKRDKLLRPAGLFGLDGSKTVYHRTTPEGAAQIRRTGKFLSKEHPPRIYVSDRHDTHTTGYGSEVVALTVPEEWLQLDDEFPNGESHYAIDVHRLSKKNLAGPNIVDGKRSTHTDAELTRKGYRPAACKSGLDRKGLAKCWTLDGLGRKPTSKDVTRAIIDNLAGIKLTKVDRLPGTDLPGYVVTHGGITYKIFKGYNKQWIAMTDEHGTVGEAKTLKEIQEAIERGPIEHDPNFAPVERDVPVRMTVLDHYDLDERGAVIRKKLPPLEGANVGDKFKRHGSRAVWHVDAIVRPERTVGTLKIGETIRVTDGETFVEITNAQGAWIDGEGKRWKPSSGLKGLADRDAIIASVVTEAAQRAKPWGSHSRKVFVSDVFEQVRADGRDDGMSIDEFKAELMRLHRAGKLRLARADLVAAMPERKVAASEIDANGATFHFVER